MDGSYEQHHGWEVPKLEYVETPIHNLPEVQRIHIVLCSRCRERYVEDPTRDYWGNLKPASDLTDEDLEPTCMNCMWELVGEAFEADTLRTLERRLGLAEKNKETIAALMSIIENPDRVIMVARVQDRVDELERRLEDRTEALRDSVESRLEGANTRLFISSLISTVALFLVGLVVGVIVTLVLGG